MPDGTVRVRWHLFRTILELSKMHERACAGCGYELDVQVERAKAAMEAEKHYLAVRDELPWGARLDARGPVLDTHVPLRELAALVEKLATHLAGRRS